MIGGAARISHDTWGRCSSPEAALVIPAIEQNVKVIVHPVLSDSTPGLLNSFPSWSNAPFSISILPFLSKHLAFLLSFLYNILISDSTYHTKRCHTKPCVELQYCPKCKKQQHLNANLLISLWANGSTPPRLLHLTSLLHSIY